MKIMNRKLLVLLFALVMTLCFTLTGCALLDELPMNKQTGEQSNEESPERVVKSPEKEEEKEEEQAEPDESEGLNAAENTETSGTEIQEETSETAEDVTMLELTVYPREYLVDILKDMVDLGIGEDVEALIELTETVSRENMLVFAEPEDEDAWVTESQRAFRAEGFIAPGTYQFPETITAEEAITELLTSWDKLIPASVWEKASEQGFSMAQVLTMASIIEYESSEDPTGSQEVKEQVSAVIHNRLDIPMGLEMDVTIFYLEEALEPYLDPDDYKEYYNTYATEELPAGPINSPSLESIMASLTPADIEALYFVYDREGNYYFSDDFETHLYYVDLYLD